ncbi:MAG: hypothetical protein APF81_18895 [Desulfosporosinus sp. BRH_c37]|nr:MAG: hypothetical protein APF81_18895 [Desulfosporosinus sp. BRH_c37]
MKIWHQALVGLISLNKNAKKWLMAPLSLAMLDLQGNQDTYRDPIALLEALRRASGKFFVFCQKGQIAVPKTSQLLYSYLESMVIEVMSPNPHGVFHPKTWLLRFTSDDGPEIYRFLCLSRNLTFDRSWDNILTLEGEVGKRRYARNRPLADFVKSLPSMGQSLIDPKVLASIDSLAEKVMRVQFQAPEGFENLAFWPMGIPKYHKLPIQGSHPVAAPKP